MLCHFRRVSLHSTHAALYPTYFSTFSALFACLSAVNRRFYPFSYFQLHASYDSLLYSRDFGQSRAASSIFHWISYYDSKRMLKNCRKMSKIGVFLSDWNLGILPWFRLGCPLGKLAEKSSVCLIEIREFYVDLGVGCPLRKATVLIER